MVLRGHGRVYKHMIHRCPREFPLHGISVKPAFKREFSWHERGAKVEAFPVVNLFRSSLVWCKSLCLTPLRSSNLNSPDDPRTRS